MMERQFYDVFFKSQFRIKVFFLASITIQNVVTHLNPTNIFVCLFECLLDGHFIVFVHASCPFLWCLSPVLLQAVFFHDTVPSAAASCQQSQETKILSLVQKHVVILFKTNNKHGSI